MTNTDELRGRLEVQKRRVQHLKGSDPLGMRRDAEAQYAKTAHTIVLLEGLVPGRKKYRKAEAATR